MQSDAQAAPVLGLLIDPDSDAAVVVSVAANLTGEIARVVGGMIEAIELDGGSVMWLDADGKNRGLPTNLLATKVAHRLHAGLYPDDTINGRALVFGETELPDRGPVATDLSPTTRSYLRDVGVEVRAQPSQEVLIAGGGSWLSSLNHSNAGGGCMVTTQQIDDLVYVVGQDDFTIGVYPVHVWLGEADGDPELIDCGTAEDAWTLLQFIREHCLVHQCRDCNGWLFASARERVDQLTCGSCGSVAVN